MDSKFINSQTLEYLKSKQSSTYQQQIDNLKERVNLESTDLTRIETTQLELYEKISYLGSQLQATQQAFDTKLTVLDGFIDGALAKQIQFETTTKIAISGLSIILLGVAACLVKLLT